MQKIELAFKKTDQARDLELPRYMTDGSSGMDLYAAVQDPLKIEPGKTAIVPTGIMVAVPQGFELQVRPRSGLAAKNGIGVLNSPGTIDSDYRGEIKVILINLGEETFEIKRKDRIAQIILCPVVQAVPVEYEQLPYTERSDGGFGHTGLKS